MRKKAIRNLKKRLGSLDKKRILSLNSVVPCSIQYRGCTLEYIINTNVFYLRPMIESLKIELDNEAYQYYMHALEESSDRYYRED